LSVRRKVALAFVAVVCDRRIAGLRWTSRFRRSARQRVPATSTHVPTGSRRSFTATRRTSRTSRTSSVAPPCGQDRWLRLAVESVPGERVGHTDASGPQPLRVGHIDLGVSVLRALRTSACARVGVTDARNTINSSRVTCCPRSVVHGVTLPHAMGSIEGNTPPRSASVTGTASWRRPCPSRRSARP